MQQRPSRGGRNARLARRAAGPPSNPCPPGASGGQYAPLSVPDMREIFDTALKLLADLGMGDVPAELADRLVALGCRLDANNRILIPRTLVDAALAKTPKQFTFHGRDPKRSITVGGTAVHFGTGGAAVQTMDLDSGHYRSSTLRDLHDFTRLQDTLVNVSWFTRCCIATDIEDPFELDVNTAFALITNTTKPVGTAFTLASHVAPIVEMFDIAAGGVGKFSERPFAKAHISPVISPMRFGEDAVEVAFECARHNIPVSCITAAQAGATAPPTMAGFLAQSLAETLASLVMMHAIRPGHPMIFSNWPLVIDLRTGAFTGGGGETALLNAASAQLSNWLGLISGVAASMTDAKAVDAQYGVEKGMTSLAAALAGGNLIYESSGMMAALLGVSFEAFILDDEMHGHSYRVLRGPEVSDSTLGYQNICDRILDEGHFLGAADTLAATERDYFYPPLADRTSPDAWQAEGAQDAKLRARVKAQEVLATHHPEYLSDSHASAIRARFPIR